MLSGLVILVVSLVTGKVEIYEREGKRGKFYSLKTGGTPTKKQPRRSLKERRVMMKRVADTENSNDYAKHIKVMTEMYPQTTSEYYWNLSEKLNKDLKKYRPVKERRITIKSHKVKKPEPKPRHP